MKYSRGQAGIIVLLVTVVMLSLGISIASRSTSDISSSASDEQAQRSLDAAESAIEDAFSKDLTNVTSGQVVIDGVVANYTVEPRNFIEAGIEESEAVGVLINGAVTGNALVVDWSKTTGCTASLIIAIITPNSDPNVRDSVRRVFAGGCNNASDVPARDDGFSTSNVPPAGDPYKRRVTVPLRTGETRARIKSVYGRTDLKVVGSGWVLPVQEYKIKATATEATGETKAIEVIRSAFPEIPSVLDYALYAGAQIEQ